MLGKSRPADQEHGCADGEFELSGFILRRHPRANLFPVHRLMAELSKAGIDAAANTVEPVAVTRSGLRRVA